MSCVLLYFLIQTWKSRRRTPQTQQSGEHVMETHGVTHFLKMTDLSPRGKWKESRGWIQRVAQWRLLLSTARKLVDINTQRQYKATFTKPNGEIKGDKMDMSQGDLSRPGCSGELPTTIPVWGREKGGQRTEKAKEGLSYGLVGRFGSRDVRGK